jgi:hypothetical protein
MLCCARLKQRRWADVVAACDAAIELQPAHAKALFRRAQANHSIA